MANPQHIQWLLEGVEAWNKRRMDRFFDPELWFTPDFSEADLPGEPLSGALLDYSNFTGAALWRTNLTGANLIHANLTRANLTGADLTDANLTDATLTDATLTAAALTGANLTRADLTRVWLSRAVLSKANLRGAVLNDTDLVGVDLKNVNLMQSQPWEAKIFPRPTDETVSPLRFKDVCKTVKTIGQLLEIIRAIKARYETHRKDLIYFFRGESQRGWPLIPSLVRGGALQRYEQRMLLDLLTRRPEDFSGAETALSRWVLARHHGLKTRFLDITSNPLVAMFHACEEKEEKADAKNPKADARLHVFAVPSSLVKPYTSDVISVIANFARLDRYHQQVLLGEQNLVGEKRTVRTSDHEFAKLRLYQFIKQEKPYFEERIDPRDFYRVFVVEPQQTSERIRAQSGAFLVSAFHTRFEQQEILKWNDDIPVYAHYQLTIPAGKKTQIIEDLQIAGITRESLFPGLDETTKAITERYEM